MFKDKIRQDKIRWEILYLPHKGKFQELQLTFKDSAKKLCDKSRIRMCRLKEKNRKQYNIFIINTV